MAQSILICEDDLTLANLLQHLLRERGYTTIAVRQGREAVRQVREKTPALLVLDLLLPDMDGFDVCRQVRAHCQAPVIMISARAGELDRIIGLELGADDFLTRPFGVAQLVARIDAHLRRARDYAGRVEPPGRREIGELRLDREAHEVTLRGQPLHLTPKEFDLLCALADDLGAVVRSAHLLMKVWGYDSRIRTRTLDVHVGRLRAKIEADPRHPRYLLTVPGVGYKLCVPEALARAA